MNILDTVVQHKKNEIFVKQNEIPISVLRNKISLGEGSPHSVIKSMKENSEFHFICEIKKASPSKGMIQPDFNPVNQAQKYIKGGAFAISVLTDSKFFQGDLAYLTSIKKLYQVPVLRKDFIIDEYQIFESKAAGADFVLLIARILEKHHLRELAKLAIDLKMDVLLEIYEYEEIDKLPDDLPLILGINNRNLKDFSVDLTKSFKLMESLPNHLPVISESGISSPEECIELHEHGFSGVLMGETLMRSENPELLLKQFREKVNHAYST